MEQAPLKQAPKTPSMHWLAAAVGLFIVFSVVWFSRLDMRPMHNDEGVNAMFVQKLITKGQYKYDPVNYHGPSFYFLYYLPTRAAALWRDGISKFSIHSPSGLSVRVLRSGVALTGLLILLGCLLAYNWIGFSGAITAFLLLATSCDFFFYSRYFIHETLFMFFALGIYLSFFAYRLVRRPLYLCLGWCSVSFFFCTKETSVVGLIVMGLSIHGAA